MRKNMFIIIEGPDNVGKTTLINKLTNHFNYMTFQCLHYGMVKHPTLEQHVAYNKKQYTELFKMMQHHTTLDNAGIICDRAHLGEMVYGPIYRGYTGEYVLDIEKEFINYKPIWDNLFLITLTDKAERLIEREDGESFSIDLDKKLTELANFRHAHESSNIVHKYTVDIETFDADAVGQIVIDYIEGQ